MTSLFAVGLLEVLGARFEHHKPPYLHICWADEPSHRPHPSLLRPRKLGEKTTNMPLKSSRLLSPSLYLVIKLIWLSNNSAEHRYFPLFSRLPLYHHSCCFTCDRSLPLRALHNRISGPIREEAVAGAGPMRGRGGSKSCWKTRGITPRYSCAKLQILVSSNVFYSH